MNSHSLDSRRTRGLPGGSYRFGYSGHVAYSHGTRRTLSAWHSVWAFPGHVAHSNYFRMWSHGLGTRDTWFSRNAPGNTLSVDYSGRVALSEAKSEGVSKGSRFRHSGHVACSEGLRRGVSKGFRLGLRNTRHITKEKLKGSFGVTSETRGIFRRKVRRVSGPGHSEGFRRGFLSGWLLVVGLGIDGWGSSGGSDRDELRSDWPNGRSVPSRWI